MQQPGIQTDQDKQRQQNIICTLYAQEQRTQDPDQDRRNRNNSDLQHTMMALIKKEHYVIL